MRTTSIVSREHSEMEEPTFTDYVTLIFNLFERFVQTCQMELDWYSGRYDYEHKSLMVFFVMMQQRRMFRFKAMWRWLKSHPLERAALGFEQVPHQVTLSRRYKELYQVLQAFIAFLGQYAEQIDEQFEIHDLYEDKSLFKARGPV